MEAVGNWLNALLDRTLRAAGAITAFCTVGALGLGVILTGPQQAAGLALLTFGVIGALESLHRQRNTQAEYLRVAANLQANNTLFFQVLDKNPGWQPQLLKEFTHDGLVWQAYGFDQFKVPVLVAGPLCPRCQAKLTERITVGFPGRMRSHVACSCGWSQQLAHPVAQLRKEVEHLAGIPC